MYKYFKDIYDDVNKNRDRLNGKFTPSITLLVTIMTAQVWITSNILKLEPQYIFLKIINYSLLILGFFTVASCFYFFVLTYFKYPNCNVSAENIKNFYDALNNSENDSPRYWKEQYFISGVSELYLLSALENQKNNAIKGRKQIQMFTTYALSLPVLFLEYIWFVLLYDMASDSIMAIFKSMIFYLHH